MKLLLTLVLIASSSFAEANLFGGSEDVQNDGIFHIAIKEKGSEDADLCTASKIGPESFLTAAHCFDNHKIYSVMLSAASKKQILHSPILQLSQLSQARTFQN